MTLGRPPRSGSAAERRTIRVTDVEWKLWKDACSAAKTETDVSTEIRNRMNQWAKRQLAKSKKGARR